MCVCVCGYYFGLISKQVSPWRGYISACQPLCPWRYDKKVSVILFLYALALVECKLNLHYIYSIMCEPIKALLYVRIKKLTQAHFICKFKYIGQLLSFYVLCIPEVYILINCNVHSTITGPYSSLQSFLKHGCKTGHTVKRVRM